MATIVTKAVIEMRLEDENGNSILVRKYQDGVATIKIHTKFYHYEILKEDEEKQTSTTEIEAGLEFFQEINEIEKFISGAFDRESNFNKVINQLFNKPEDEEFLAFELIIEDATAIIMKENSSIYDIEETINNAVNRAVISELKRMAESLVKENMIQDQVEAILEYQEVPYVSEQAEERVNEICEEYCDKLDDSEENEIDPNFAIEFITYVYYMIVEMHADYKIAIKTAYETFQSIDYGLESTNDELNSIKIVEKYLKYGKEIREWYENKAHQELIADLDFFK